MVKNINQERVLITIKGKEAVTTKGVLKFTYCAT